MKNIHFLLLLFTLSFIACNNAHPNQEDIYNQSASLSKNSTLPSDVLDWKVITTMINKKAKTMSTLYGNEAAFKAANDLTDEKTSPYPAGAELALVTWWQKPDIHWFGANIPGKIQKVELLKFSINQNAAVQPRYKIYQGDSLTSHIETDTMLTAKNINFILRQRIASVPQ